MTRHYSYDDEGPEYNCHYCTLPITDNHLLHSTEYAGRELYFCSKSCLYSWDTVDDTEEYHDH